MGIDTSETLAQRAAQSLVDLNEAILEGSGDLAVECAAVITALSVANAQLERERDDARASVATCQAFVAARGTNRDYQQARAEKAEAERDAATAALAKAEGERDRLREALQKLAGIAAIAWMDSNAQRFRIWTDARAALTPAPEAPKDGE